MKLNVDFVVGAEEKKQNEEVEKKNDTPNSHTPKPRKDDARMMGGVLCGGFNFVESL